MRNIFFLFLGPIKPYSATGEGWGVSRLVTPFQLTPSLSHSCTLENRNKEFLVQSSTLNICPSKQTKQINHLLNGGIKSIINSSNWKLLLCVQCTYMYKIFRKLIYFGSTYTYILIITISELDVLTVFYSMHAKKRTQSSIPMYQIFIYTGEYRICLPSDRWISTNDRYKYLR